MATIEIEDVSDEAYRRNIGAFHDLASLYHSDADYRRRIEADPVAAFQEKGIELPRGVEIRVTANTDDKFHVVLPPNLNTELGDETLAVITGGGNTAGTAGSGGTLSSWSCSTTPMCISSLSCAGSAGSS